MEDFIIIAWIVVLPVGLIAAYILTSISEKNPNRKKNRKIKEKTPEDWKWDRVIIGADSGDVSLVSAESETAERERVEKELATLAGNSEEKNEKEKALSFGK